VVLHAPHRHWAAAALLLAAALAFAAVLGACGARAGTPGRQSDAGPGGWSALAGGGSFGPGARIPPAGTASAPPLEATAAVLMDAAGGRVLFAKDAHRRLYPASVTKILTAYVVLRALGGGPAALDAPVTISRQATAAGGSSMYLRAGAAVPVRDLLYGLMLASGNDAAVALGEHVAGSTAAFAALLNRTAADLGAHATHFVNPSGMPHRDHVTTAYDLALITRAALAEPELSRIVATAQYTVHFADGRSLTYHNENRLLGQDGIDGVKTGYTTQAGQTYVASATRGGMRLIAVVIGSSRAGKYRDAGRLLAWGFARYESVPLPPPGRAAGQTQLRGGTARYVDLTLPPDAPTAVAVLPGERVSVATDAPTVADAPVRLGQAMGTLTVWIGDHPYGRWPLLAAKAVGKPR